MAVTKPGRRGEKARRASNPAGAQGSQNRATANVRKAKPAKSKAAEQHVSPSPANEGWAVHVSRAALQDVSRRLQVAVAVAAACRTALITGKADAHADIVLALQWAVIEVIRRQISRLDVIASASVKKGHVVAVVTP